MLTWLTSVFESETQSTNYHSSNMWQNVFIFSGQWIQSAMGWRNVRVLRVLPIVSVAAFRRLWSRYVWRQSSYRPGYVSRQYYPTIHILISTTICSNEIFLLKLDCSINGRSLAYAKDSAVYRWKIPSANI